MKQSQVYPMNRWIRGNDPPPPPPFIFKRLLDDDILKSI